MLHFCFFPKGMQGLPGRQGAQGQRGERVCTKSLCFYDPQLCYDAIAALSLLPSKEVAHLFIYIDLVICFP